MITDVNMSEMDGFQLLEIVQNEINLPVIMISVDSEFEGVLKAINYGAVDYLVKPVRLEELKLIWRHAVKRYLNEKKDANEIRSKDVQISELVKKSKYRVRERNDDANNDSEDGLPSQKRARFTWTSELHARFIDVVNQLGVKKAVPRKIFDMMTTPELTREIVANHLQ
ncbi:two-component response regulator ARR10-like, partial [Phalaenopsis equestris]|uniref:two-component response regulator ARR10-like n=1 Tax=Phalaenopsis equestris TaxID=78828 RepID=UPI0009E24500